MWAGCSVEVARGASGQLGGGDRRRGVEGRSGRAEVAGGAGRHLGADPVRGGRRQHRCQIWPVRREKGGDISG